MQKNPNEGGNLFLKKRGCSVKGRSLGKLSSWQPELLEKGTIMYGHKPGQPLPEDAVREACGREIGLMATHGMYGIVARAVARGKLVERTE